MSAFGRCAGALRHVRGNGVGNSCQRFGVAPGTCRGTMDAGASPSCLALAARESRSQYFTAGNAAPKRKQATSAAKSERATQLLGRAKARVAERSTRGVGSKAEVVSAETESGDQHKNGGKIGSQPTRASLMQFLREPVEWEAAEGMRRIKGSCIMYLPQETCGIENTVVDMEKTFEKRFGKVAEGANESVVFPQQAFSRMDMCDDATFYGEPRIGLHHIDDAAQEKLRDLYEKIYTKSSSSQASKVIPKQHDNSESGALAHLDLCSSWVSRWDPSKWKKYPNPASKYAPKRVIGVGLNMAELEANALLTERHVYDLNATALKTERGCEEILTGKWGITENSLISATIDLSIDFLIHPLPLLKALRKMLRRGSDDTSGSCVVTFSKPMFAPKAIDMWLQAEDCEKRAKIVASYLWLAGFHKVKIHGDGNNFEGGVNKRGLRNGGQFVSDAGTRGVEPTKGNDPITMVVGWK